MGCPESLGMGAKVALRVFMRERQAFENKKKIDCSRSITFGGKDILLGLRGEVLEGGDRQLGLSGPELCRGDTASACESHQELLARITLILVTEKISESSEASE